MMGLPIGSDMEFQGGLLDLLRPYGLLVGALAVTTFLMHGSIYLYLKTEGELQARIYGWMRRSFFAFLAAYAFVTIVTLRHDPARGRRTSRSIPGPGWSSC